jgi:hypothetical protein
MKCRRNGDALIFGTRLRYRAKTKRLHPRLEHHPSRPVRPTPNMDGLDAELLLPPDDPSYIFSLAAIRPQSQSEGYKHHLPNEPP